MGLAANIGTSLLKYIPGVNVAVALLIQPPIVMALTYTAGKSYKKYFSTYQRTGKRPDDSEIEKLAKALFKEGLEKAKESLKKGKKKWFK